MIWVRTCSRSMLTLSFTWWRQNWQIVFQFEVICETHCNFSLISGETKLSRVERINATTTHIEATTLTLRLFQVNLHMKFTMVLLKLTTNQYLVSKLYAHWMWHELSWVKIDDVKICWFWYHCSGNHQVWGKSGLRIFHDFSENLQTQLSPNNPSRELSVFNSTQPHMLQFTDCEPSEAVRRGYREVERRTAL